MMIYRSNYPFVGTLEKNVQRTREDIRVLTKWAQGAISTKYAIKRIAENNDAPILEEDEFIEIAKSLGYNRFGYDDGTIGNG